MMAASAAASVEVTRSRRPDFSHEAWRVCGSKAAAMMAPGEGRGGGGRRGDGAIGERRGRGGGERRGDGAG